MARGKIYISEPIQDATLGFLLTALIQAIVRHVLGGTTTLAIIIVVALQAYAIRDIRSKKRDVDATGRILTAVMIATLAPVFDKALKGGLDYMSSTAGITLTPPEVATTTALLVMALVYGTIMLPSRTFAWLVVVLMVWSTGTNPLLATVAIYLILVVRHSMKRSEASRKRRRRRMPI